MERKIISTADGSSTIEIADNEVTYHSRHGALKESQHVFIKAGLNYLINELQHKPINILEMGFGTGLNALLTALEAESKKVKINYHSLEAYPLSESDYNGLNYGKISDQQELFIQLHECEWEKAVDINEYFVLTKLKTSLEEYSTNQLFKLIYYDAFAPSAQPELWTKEIFEKLFALLDLNGILVTYCSKGYVRRAMMAAGFKVENLQSPPGKREMLRACKTAVM